jgi:hypothetical protein
VAYDDAAIPPVSPGGIDLGFLGRHLRRMDVVRTAEAWDISCIIQGEGDGRDLRCAFRDVQWMQMAGTWRQGLRVIQFYHRPVPDTLRETLPSLITHGDLYSLTVRGGSHINLVAAGIDLTPA